MSMMALTVSAFAQREVGVFTIQPKLGLNIANITDADDSDPRFGLVAGAESEWQVTKMISLSTALLYSAQGDKESGYNTNGVPVKLTAQLDYINIPIMANIYAAKGLAFKLGVQPGFCVRSEYELKGGGVTVSGSMSDIGISINTFDLSIPVGISYEYKNFVIDGRYNFGITNMVKGDTKNRVIQFTIGYRFDLK